VKDAARLAVAAGAGALAARGAYAALRRYPPAGEQTWSRTNHRGEPVTLLEGPAVTVGALAGQAVSAAVTVRLAVRSAAATGQPERAGNSAARATGAFGVGRTRRAAVSDAGNDSPGTGRSDLAVMVAGLGAVAFGTLDDLRGSAKRRGLRGHLGALARGEVTTGAVKLAGLAATGAGAALIEGGDPADVAINAGLIAGGANLLNLFDLRPGRAVKVAALSAAALAAAGARTPGRAPGAGAAAVAAPLGAALALLPEDLGERAMLGDAGANALGAMLGAAAARTLPRPARAALLGGIVALTAASEKVSFTKVIAASPPLNWLDMLGRRPAAQAPQAAAVPGVPAADSTAAGGTVSGGTAADSTAAGGTAAGGKNLAGPVPARSRRYRRWRRRGTDPGETRVRSGSWRAFLLKTVTRREP
jgi:UDP-GlcNAc:undecaprenyl-phosphate GlcNAc-1-phosphate transferase